jgi:hypothetical protein
MSVNITKPYPPDVLFLDAYNCFTPVDTSLSIAIGQKDWATARRAAEKLCEMTKIVLHDCTRGFFCTNQSAGVEAMIKKLREVAEA